MPTEKEQHVEQYQAARIYQLIAELDATKDYSEMYNLINRCVNDIVISYRLFLID
jgi:hypothetical protein